MWPAVSSVLRVMLCVLFSILTVQSNGLWYYVDVSSNWDRRRRPRCACLRVELIASDSAFRFRGSSRPQTMPRGICLD